MSKGMLGYICAFSLGAAVGAVATWKLLERKCEQYINEEIDALRELRAERQSEDTTATVDVDEKLDNTGEQYMEIITKNGYVKYSDIKQFEDADNVLDDEPYVISPDAYGMKLEYEEVSLVYYTDEVLADMDDNVIENPEELIGDALEHFGDYDENSVHVRDDVAQKDYEILLSAKRYSDVVPPDVED